jgi:hypothetical protein
VAGGKARTKPSRASPSRPSKPAPAARTAASTKKPAPKVAAPKKAVAKPAPKIPAKPAASKAPAAKHPASKPAPAGSKLPSTPPRGDGRQHVLSLSFVRDGDEFMARLETDAGQITELKNRSLDQLLTLVAGELEDLLE